MKRPWLVLALGVVACSEDAATGPRVGTSTARVLVWPTSLSLNAPDAFALETSVSALRPGQAAPSFTCTSNLPSVVNVENCVVHALANGTATITITSNAATDPATIAVTVSDQRVACPTLPGTHVYRTSVTSDPDGRAASIGMRDNIELQITQNPDNSVFVTGLSPFINTSGVFSVNCELSSVGTGTAGDVSNVSARFTGPIMVNGALTFRYTLGSNGAFAGGHPIVYTFTRQ